MDAQALERRYLNAMRISDMRLDEAHTLLEQLKSVHPDRHRVILYEANYAHFSSRRNTGSSLRRLINEVIDDLVSTPETTAMAFVDATHYAMVINDTGAIAYLTSTMKSFWSAYGDDPDVIRWRAGCDLNVGIHRLRNNDHHSAIELFESMLRRFDGRPEYACWLTSIYSQMTVAYARLGDITTARMYAELADHHALTHSRHQALYAWGEVAVAEAKWETAKALFLNAYRHASEFNSFMTMAYAQIMLCRCYRELGNLDALWLSYEIAHNLSRNNGVPHVFGVLAEIVTGVPSIAREEVIRV